MWLLTWYLWDKSCQVQLSLKKTQHGNTERKNPSTTFYHHGIKVKGVQNCITMLILMILDTQICLKTFLFLHGIGRRRYDTVRQYYVQNGIEDGIHGNTKRLPHHGITTEDLKIIVSFLQNYAEQNAILLPGRIPSFKRTDVQLLTNTTKKGVWNCYVKACATQTFRMATFCKLWKCYVPHIIIMHLSMARSTGDVREGQEDREGIESKTTPKGGTFY